METLMLCRNLIIAAGIALTAAAAACATDTVHVAYSVTNAYQGSYEAQIVLRNDASWSIPTWRLEFDLPSQINNLWNGVIISHTGDHYVIGPPAWDDGNLSPGESITPGFTATPAAPVGGPTSGSLNGTPVSLNGDSPAPPRPVPVPAPAWPRRFLAPYIDAPAGSLPSYTCRADFNGSGSLSVQDIFDFLAAWFAQDPRADINGGGLSVQDIFDFLTSWFGGC